MGEIQFLPISLTATLQKRELFNITPFADHWNVMSERILKVSNHVYAVKKNYSLQMLERVTITRSERQNKSKKVLY